MRRFLPRVVSVLCVMQSLVIIICYMMIRAFHKAVVNFDALDYYHPPWPAKLVYFTGPWLLLIPFTWAISVILFADVEGGVAEISEKHTRIGYALLIVVTLLCVFAVAGEFVATFSISKRL